MPSTYRAWLNTKLFLLRNPEKKAAIVTPEGVFTITFEKRDPSKLREIELHNATFSGGQMDAHENQGQQSLHNQATEKHAEHFTKREATVDELLRYRAEELREKARRMESRALELEALADNLPRNVSYSAQRAIAAMLSEGRAFDYRY
jgi:hypothetical protein